MTGQLRSEHKRRDLGEKHSRQRGRWYESQGFVSLLCNGAGEPCHPSLSSSVGEPNGGHVTCTEQSQISRAVMGEMGESGVFARITNHSGHFSSCEGQIVGWEGLSKVYPRPRDKNAFDLGTHTPDLIKILA